MFVELGEQAKAWKWPGDAGESWRAQVRTTFFIRAHPGARIDALVAARQRQVQLLRTILRNPFAQPALDVPVHFAGGRLFCGRCGPVQPRVAVIVDDVRFRSCGACSTLLLGIVTDEGRVGFTRVKGEFRVDVAGDT